MHPCAHECTTTHCARLCSSEIKCIFVRSSALVQRPHVTLFRSLFPHFFPSFFHCAVPAFSHISPPSTLPPYLHHLHPQPNISTHQTANTHCRPHRLPLSFLSHFSIFYFFHTKPNKPTSPKFFHFVPIFDNLKAQSIATDCVFCHLCWFS
jgi:hypothetical protein